LLKDKNAIAIHTIDNCAVAIIDINKDEIVFDGIKILEDIKAGHKFALKNIGVGESIVKYGHVIGVAKEEISVGAHIHTHNIKTGLKGILEYNYNPTGLTGIAENTKKDFELMAYKRKNGEVGIRNEIWIINTVGCINKVAATIAKKANEKHTETQGTTGIDGIYTFEHPFGCSQLGDDHLKTQMILKNMVTHPNAAGVLVLGLGCENNTMGEFKKVLGEIDSERVKFLVCQDVDDEVAAGLEIIDGLVDYAKQFKREKVSVENLVIGLKCGGSDGFSGITANPLVGKISDIIIEHGGSALLTEVPEMFGAEDILMNRAINENVYNKTVNLINDFKNYFMRYDQEIYENPSPGNKNGGISTLEDKSLGCTQKSGSKNVVDVLDYGDVVKEKGLNLLNGPGNDIVAMTNLMAAHAHVILFTTGRGTPVGTAVPTIKIASNSDLYNRKNNWMDFDAGVMLEDATIDKTAEDLFKYIIDVCEGKKTKNEINEYREISIFKDGVTL